MSGKVEVAEYSPEEMAAACLKAEAGGCKGCGATAEQMRLIPGGRPQLGYAPGSSFPSMDFVIESCPLCKPLGSA